MPYTAYIVKTENDRLYVGHTNNLPRRLVEHSLGSEGAKFLKESGVPFGVVYIEDFSTRSEAVQREKQLKGWTRAKKEALVSGDLQQLKSL